MAGLLRTPAHVNPKKFMEKINLDTIIDSPYPVTKEDLIGIEIKINEAKYDVIKWLFITCIVQIYVIIAYVLLFLSMR